MGPAPVKEQVIHFINKKMPGNLPKKTARALLDIEDKNYVPDSPQQRSLATTVSPTSALTVFIGSCCFIGLWHGSW